MAISGRQRQVAVGCANLEQHRAKASTRARELEVDIAAFRVALLRDVGPNPTASKVALVEAVATTYAAILVVRRKLIHGHKSDVATMTERVSRLTSNMARLLKALNLDTRPKPRTLAEVFARKPAPTAAVETAKAAIPVENEGKPL